MAEDGVDGHGFSGECDDAQFVAAGRAQQRNYLRDNFSSRISLDRLGLMARMCRFALVRAFTREIGIPSHSCQTYLRVLRAREIIAAGRPLSDVALEVGFTDQSHLTRHFKRLLGVTPGLCAQATRQAYRSRRTMRGC